MNASARVWCVIPAAGVGRRMGSEIPKQYLQIHGRAVLTHTLERLLGHPELAGGAVVLGAEDGYWPEVEAELSAPVRQRLMRAEGGSERCHSVLNGLERLAEQAGPTDWVLVHDAARPCVRREDIDRLLAHRESSDGAILAMPVRDTMKRGDTTRGIQNTVEREGLWHALTPQLFPLSTLRHVLTDALSNQAWVTDEASAMERLGGHPALVEGHGDNIKITRPEDLGLAEFFLQQQERESC